MMISRILKASNMTLRSQEHSKLRACLRQSARRHLVQMNVKSRPPKPKANRSRTGCEQCKARKVKCDEQKPGCKRCVAGNKECVYIAPKVSHCHQIFVFLITDVARSGCSNPVRVLVWSLVKNSIKYPEGLPNLPNVRTVFVEADPGAAKRTKKMLVKGRCVIHAFWDM